MDNYYFDVIIIGSGLAGLYSALKIKKICPDMSFIVIEKERLYGGRSYDYKFENSDVVTGAGIGRKKKDKLLLKLMKEFNIPIHTFETGHIFSDTFNGSCDVKSVFLNLKNKYINDNKNTKQKTHVTFKQYAKEFLGEKAYAHFIECSGYSDYENADVYDTFYNYNFDDNYSKWEGFSVPWKVLVDKIVSSLGNSIRNNSEVTKIKNQENYYEIVVKNNNDTKNTKDNLTTTYYCEKIIIATDIDALHHLIRDISPNPKLYNNIKGQSFLRMYAKFSKDSIPLLKEKIQGVLVVKGPIQKIIPMEPDKGIYMIVYSDNADADFFKKYFKNNIKNRTALTKMVEKAINLDNRLHIENIKDFYWKNGTHYYAPLTSEFSNRQEFIKKAQHPNSNILVVGEVISLHQGWVEGALESVESTVTKKWLHN